jgi:hypothetical protein
MPTMKIHGADRDHVEYEFNSFPAGHNLKTPGYEKIKETAGKNICFNHPEV